MMKRAIILLTMSVALSFAAPQMSADDCRIDGIYYNLNKDKQTAEVTKPKGVEGAYSGDIVIPENVEFEGVCYTVTEIGNSAFFKSAKLESVSIPNTIVKIGAGAFSCCSGLTAVRIPDSVTEIYSGAFYKCTRLS